MPTYAYACKDCDHAFDVVQSFSDDSLTDCPECAGTLRKKFDSVGVVFKGSGFYRNDSRSEGSGSQGGGASTSASPNGSDGSSSGSDGTTGASAGSDGSSDSSSPEKKSGSSTSNGSGAAATRTPVNASV